MAEEELGTVVPDANASPQGPEAQGDPEGKTPETTDSQGSEAESSPAADQSGDTEKPKESKGVQKRLDELTRNWREAERREQALLDLLSRQPKQPEQPPEKPKTLKDFDYDEAAYTAHLVELSKAEAVEAARQEASKWRDEQTKLQRNQSFESRAAEFAKETKDYHEVVSGSSWACSEPMADAIRESEDGPDIAYHLAQNPDLASTLAQLGPVSAAREIGRIEARLAQSREQAKQKPVSKAPPPVPSIEGAEPGMSVKASSPDSDKLSTRDWLKRRNKELEQR